MTKGGEEGILNVKSYSVIKKSGFGVYISILFSLYYSTVI